MLFCLFAFGYWFLFRIKVALKYRSSFLRRCIRLTTQSKCSLFLSTRLIKSSGFYGLIACLNAPHFETDMNTICTQIKTIVVHQTEEGWIRTICMNFRECIISLRDILYDKMNISIYCEMFKLQLNNRLKTTKRAATSSPMASYE